ncbi:MAG: BrnA antitoxin family protein [Proteobacteria bacterium]|nr:BrnA antitoxin family protein [Pseudomonadota bacterium]
MAKSKIASARLPDDRVDIASPVASAISRSDEPCLPTNSRKLISNQARESRKESSAPDKWSEFDNLDDKQIAKAVAKDRDAAPVGDGDFWRNASVIMPVPKQPISIRLDEDVVTFFKKPGPGYQSRMNAVLRSYMEAKK